MENGRTERQIEFIVNTLAELAVNDQKHDQRLSRLERVSKLIIEAGLRERKNRNEADERLTAA